MASISHRASIARRPVAGGNATQSPPPSQSAAKQTRSVSTPDGLIDNDVSSALPVHPGDARKSLSSDLKNFGDQVNEFSPLKTPEMNLVQNVQPAPPQDLSYNYPGVLQSPAESSDGHVRGFPATPDYTTCSPSPPLSSSSKSQSATEESQTSRSGPLDFARNSISITPGKSDPLIAQTFAALPHAYSEDTSHPGLTAVFNIITEDQGVPTAAASESLSPRSLTSTVTSPIPELPSLHQTEGASFATVCCQCSCCKYLCRFLLYYLSL
jgi:hypothetical protein